ncbi:hypothetical protein SLA2020_484310 [Shorea laevis]
MPPWEPVLHLLGVVFFNSRVLLQEGLMWRVGTGNSIRIWKDKWMPSPVSYMVQSPTRVLHPEARVCELMEVDSHGWNYPLIHAIFDPEDALKICSLPLSSHGQPDRLIWTGTSTGVFSVRSAYHLGQELLQRDLGECSRASSSITIWKTSGLCKLLRLLKLLHGGSVIILSQLEIICSKKVSFQILSVLYVVWLLKQLITYYGAVHRRLGLDGMSQAIQKLALVVRSGYELFERLVAHLGLTILH